MAMMAAKHNINAAQPKAQADNGPAIDLVHLSRQTMGDQALETELLGLFCKQSALAMERLAQESATADLYRADLAHTLKGSARAIGAGRVEGLAEALETAPAGEAGALAEDLAAAVDEVERFVAQLLAPAA